MPSLPYLPLNAMLVWSRCGLAAVAYPGDAARSGQRVRAEPALIVEEAVSGLCPVDCAADALASGRPASEFTPVDQPLPWSLFLGENPVPLETRDRLGSPLGGIPARLVKGPCHRPIVDIVLVIWVFR